MIKPTAAAVLAALVSFTAPAAAQFSYTPKEKDQVGLDLGGQFWQSNASGSVGSGSVGGGNVGQAPAQADVAFNNQRQLSLVLAVQHPYPWLPHLRIATTSLDTKGQTTLTKALPFADKTFANGDAIESQLAVRFVDYSLYYELLNRQDLSFKLGLSARAFNGDVTLTKLATSTDDSCTDPDPTNGNNCPTPDTGTSTSGQLQTDAITPMLYIDSQIRLPASHASVFATAEYAVLQDHAVADYQAGVRYDLTRILKLDTEATIGYRLLQLQFEDLHSLYTDLKFQGVFVGMTAHF